MDRTKFYNKVTTDDIEELDFLYNSLSDFITEYSIGYYRVQSSDLLDPAIISYKCYGDVGFWWIILLYNNIENPFTDLVEGMVLKIPNRLDIFSFQKKYRLRRE